MILQNSEIISLGLAQCNELIVCIKISPKEIKIFSLGMQINWP